MLFSILLFSMVTVTHTHNLAKALQLTAGHITTTTTTTQTDSMAFYAGEA